MVNGDTQEGREKRGPRGIQPAALCGVGEAGVAQEFPERGAPRCGVQVADQQYGVFRVACVLGELGELCVARMGHLAADGWDGVRGNDREHHVEVEFEVGDDGGDSPVAAVEDCVIEDGALAPQPDTKLSLRNSVM